MNTGTSRRAEALPYWLLAFALVGFGYLGLFSIGAPFFLTGAAMMAVAQWRHRPEVVWPTLVGVWSFVVGYVLVAPLGCTSTAVPALRGQPQALSRTTCTNVLGIHYSGAGTYNPSLAPAFLAGLATAAIGVGLAYGLLRRRRTST